MKQQIATSEVMRIISSSPIQSVLDAVGGKCRTPARGEQCGDSSAWRITFSGWSLHTVKFR
jgi:hypothetical protein